mgnify:CR=1 FL=1
MKWINAKTEPPEEHGHYLVFAPQSFPKNCRSLIAEYYIDGDFKEWYSEASEECLKDVTHWAKLPKDP